MFLNKIKILNKNNLSRCPLLGLRSFLRTPFPEINEFTKSIDSYEKLHHFRILKTFWINEARSRVDFDKMTTSETFEEILKNHSINTNFSNNGFLSEISNILLTILMKYLDDKSLRKIVRYLY